MTPNYLRRHDLVPQYQRMQSEIDAAIRRVLNSGRYILGDELARFEEEFAAYVDRGFGVGVASGTDALVLALRVLGLKSGEPVLTSTYSPTPVAASILEAGGVPLFVDVERQTGLMDLEQVEDQLPSCRFVMAVHLFGLPIDMPALMELAQGRGALVIEDASQAHGSWVDAQQAGHFGTLSCFSLYPTKNLGCFGDAGIILGDDAELEQHLRWSRNYGKDGHDPFTSFIRGFNSRMDELQASIARVKLKHLATFNRERKERVDAYRQGLAHLPIEFLTEPEGRQSNHHILTVLCGEERDALSEHLDAKGIQTNIYYPRSLHQMPAYQEFVRAGQLFPVAEELSRQALALPLSPELEFSQVERVISAIRQYYDGGAIKKRAAAKAQVVQKVQNLTRRHLPEATVEASNKPRCFSISVIIPVYNEVENVPIAIAETSSALDAITGDWEIIFVESGSTDGSLERIQVAAQQNSRIRYVHQAKREGMGSALRAAYAVCEKDWVCHLEADLPFDLSEIGKAAEYFDEYDFVSGYRASSEDNDIMWRYSKTHRLETLIRGTYHYGWKIFLNLVFGIYVSDINYSFKLIRRSLLSQLDLRTRGWFIDTELVFELVHAEARTKLLPVRYRERAHGTSTVNLWSPLPMMWEALKYRWRRWKPM